MRGDLWWKLAFVAALVLVALLFRSTLARATLPPADLVIANGPDPGSLDPALTQGIADGRVLAALFEGLVTAHPRTLEPEPAMAESWTLSGGALRLEFILRAGLRWSDGHPITAPDLRWSFLRVLDPATGARFADLLYPVAGARAYHRSRGAREGVGIGAPDDRTLVFELERPLACFLDILTLFPLFPAPRHRVEAFGDRWVRPELFVGNGPFRPLFWRLRDRLRVVRNEHYWDAAGVRAGAIDYLCVESAATMLNLYATGRADIVTDVPTAAVPALIEKLGPRATGEFQPEPRLGTFFYRVNTGAPPFTNAKIRRALSVAVDRQAIVDHVTRAGEAPAWSLVPRGVRAGTTVYDPPASLRCDLSLARRLLDEGLRESGLAELPSFEVLYGPEVGDQAIAEVLQRQWRALGVHCRLANLDGQAIRNALSRLEYAVARSSWIGDYNDPSTFLDLFVSGASGNRTGWSSAAYDRLVLDVAPSAATAEERTRALKAAEAILLEEAPIIPIFHYVSRTLVKPEVGGFYRNILDWHPPKGLFRARSGPR